MIKKLFRSMLLCLLVFATAIIVFFVTYRLAYKRSVNAVSDSFSLSEKISPSKEAAALSDKEIITADHYIARYDGENLSIYSVSNGQESFLYTLNVRIEDIPEQELNKLKEGISLPTRQALASFEEDFTS